MEQLCKEILGQLNIYERNHTHYTKCLGREIELIISNKPEERIRQIFLYFLINKSGLFPNRINLKVEYNNLDIAIYKNFELEDFRPLQHPIAIIEVKREEESLLSHENQLRRYLDEQRSSLGILFNGKNLVLFKKAYKEAYFSKEDLKSIEDIPGILREALHQENNDRLEFEKARDGDINSFVYLVKKYGKYTLHKFTFALKDSCDLIIGCCFRAEQDCISYDLYGNYSRKNRFSFKYHAFDKLISVIY
ncbi:type I restriction enzyme HsdR N-terminal domain-containing protein [Chroococcidiopsis sp. CCNUC1]|uniref:type I restriction enzyme HsdR N-terminal domain-containing protein n=1 Tax=Chroococcidiopsis sp. CCNUC1 TaxID=2653189 RepID=UPI0020204BA5|nr:type I restriction enzyme HsdR N-terminal domain-containing protein [Chroococcidiopsis sp. CCNUC1]URD48490.1 type I restriction enzyme HsdR N-terminal domain-containing protein [Chroococcidiopsis sp. CCNUC1]